MKLPRKVKPINKRTSDHKRVYSATKESGITPQSVICDDPDWCGPCSNGTKSCRKGRRWDHNCPC